ncbi:hypothetical protein [Streptomyces sp. DSM 40907]|uniref:hypothetical protein n=1 Tax=Streptomyces kutzneri TaxID=3051179 RepID=UPI0028D659E3|nr:hypothetical protein [Streptomyces sp. DSM 40907]
MSIVLLVLLVALILFGYLNHLLWVTAAVLLFAFVRRGRWGGSRHQGDHRGYDDYDDYRDHRDQQHRWDRRYARQHRGRRSREARRDRDREEPR